MASSQRLQSLGAFFFTQSLPALFFLICPKFFPKGLSVGKSTHRETNQFLDEQHNLSRFGLACFGLKKIKG